jgi:hypothetical protein
MSAMIASHFAIAWIKPVISPALITGKAVLFLGYGGQGGWYL